MYTNLGTEIGNFLYNKREEAISYLKNMLGLFVSVEEIKFNSYPVEILDKGSNPKQVFSIHFSNMKKGGIKVKTKNEKGGFDFTPLEDLYVSEIYSIIEYLNEFDLKK